MRTMRLYALVAVLCIAQNLPAMAADEKLTTYQRQVNLMKRINEAQKNKQLTVKQAKGLRKDLSKIAVKKDKIRNKNASGKFDSDDAPDVEERLTETSEKIEKLKQENLENKVERD